MRILSIEPTPNPNSMKIVLDERLPVGERFTYRMSNPGNQITRKILAVSGVNELFRAADFMSVQRNPGANWRDILSAIRQIVDGRNIISSDDKSALTNRASDEAAVAIQFFRDIPMLIRNDFDGQQKRVALAKRFNNAIAEVIPHVENMLAERQWVSWGQRYGKIGEIESAITAEIEALYPTWRITQLVKKALLKNGELTEEKRISPSNAEQLLESDDWKERFRALETIGPNPSKIEELISCITDERMTIRRLAAVLLGMVNDRRVVPVLCKAVSTDPAVAVRRTAGDSLNDHGDNGAIPVMINALKDRSHLVRWRAARFLFEFGDKTALEGLKDIQLDPVFEVSMQARLAIERIEGAKQGDKTVWEEITE